MKISILGFYLLTAILLNKITLLAVVGGNQEVASENRTDQIKIVKKYLCSFIRRHLLENIKQKNKLLVSFSD